MPITEQTWLERIAELSISEGDKGGLILLFPEYRPDLSKAVAHHLQLDFHDYRQQYMSPHGTEAGKIELETLALTIGELSRDKPILLFNVEALLSTRDPIERRAWLEQFVRTEWPNLVVIPLTVFAVEAKEIAPRVIQLSPEELPEQGLISRLAH